VVLVLLWGLWFILVGALVLGLRGLGSHMGFGGVVFLLDRRVVYIGFGFGL